MVIANAYECTKCKYPYILDTDATCVLTCTATATDTLVYRTYSVTGPTFTIDSFPICNTETTADCEVEVPRYVADYGTPDDDVCAKCKDTFLPVIDFSAPMSSIIKVTDNFMGQTSVMGYHFANNEC